MPGSLLITVRFYEGRFHGAGAWPPAPARLFQALVAGAAEGKTIPPPEHKALTWLETLDPPILAAPSVHAGASYKNYVPNNDLDVKGGDPNAIRKEGKKKGPAISFIRAPKHIRPQLFDASVPLLYLWHFENDPDGYAGRIATLAQRLYQLGRGVDMAWARAEIIDADDVEARLAGHPGAIYRPCESGEGRGLDCPQRGSLASLITRHEKMSARFAPLMVKAPTKGNPGRMKVAGQTFSQPPKARFVQVPYDSPPERRLFDLRDLAGRSQFHAWPLSKAVGLVETVRDRAAARLRTAYEEAGRHDWAACVDRVFIGRNATEADIPARIRIIPLPSIGFRHADPSIRRILLEIPRDCPLPHADVAWSFSGLALVEISDPETGEISRDVRLVEADDRRMLYHFGIEPKEPKDKPARLWRTVTPAALPERAGRRRLDPARLGEVVKDAKERLEEEARALGAVRQALRHAAIETPVEGIRVQREPFTAKGARAEAFAVGTRFSKHRLWHVEIAFAAPRKGPVIIGDGRYLGLGLMAPERRAFRKAAVFTIVNDAPSATARGDVLTALRRALMALDRDWHEAVSTLFSGHKADGAPAGNGSHEHVFLAADTAPDGHRLARLYVIRPDAADRKSPLPDSGKARFERVTGWLETVRAGPHGVLRLSGPTAPGPNDPLFAHAMVWTSLTDFRPTRHPRKGTDVTAFLKRDIGMEILRRGYPEPKVEVLAHSIGPRGGVRARLRLTFAVAVEGPLVLGRACHMGSGLFAAKDRHGVGGDRPAGR